MWYSWDCFHAHSSLVQGVNLFAMHGNCLIAQRRLTATVRIAAAAELKTAALVFTIGTRANRHLAWRVSHAHNRLPAADVRRAVGHEPACRRGSQRQYRIQYSKLPRSGGRAGLPGLLRTPARRQF